MHLSAIQFYIVLLFLFFQFKVFQKKVNCEVKTLNHSAKKTKTKNKNFNT